MEPWCCAPYLPSAASCAADTYFVQTSACSRGSGMDRIPLDANVSARERGKPCAYRELRPRYFMRPGTERLLVHLEEMQLDLRQHGPVMASMTLYSDFLTEITKAEPFEDRRHLHAQCRRADAGRGAASSTRRACSRTIAARGTQSPYSGWGVRRCR